MKKAKKVKPKLTRYLMDAERACHSCINYSICYVGRDIFRAVRSSFSQRAQETVLIVVANACEKFKNEWRVKCLKP